MFKVSTCFFVLGALAQASSQCVSSNYEYFGNCPGEISGLIGRYPGDVSYPAVSDSCRIPLTPSYQSVPTVAACGNSPAFGSLPAVESFASIPSVNAISCAPTVCDVGVPNYNTEPSALQPIAVDRPYSSYPTSDSCGPNVNIAPTRYLPPVVLPPVNEPIRDLGTPPMPPPTVISNKCSCTKVVQKPQLYQRIIQVQRNQRFLKKTIVPRVERVSYCAKPRC